MSNRILITFYTKPDCPLCEDAAALLEAAGHYWPLDVQIVDILKDRVLYDRYWNRVPVLQFPDGVTLEPPITRERLTALIRSHAAPDS